MSRTGKNIAKKEEKRRNFFFLKNIPTEVKNEKESRKFQKN